MTPYHRFISEIQINLPFLKHPIVFNCLRPARLIARTRKRLLADPGNVNQRLYLASLLAEQGQPEEAIQEWHKAVVELPFDAAVQDDPVLAQKNAWAHYVLGCIYSKAGAHQEALREWQFSAELDESGIGELARERMERGRRR